MDRNDFAHLIVGRRYIVVREFTDFDGKLHPKGESWTYLGKSFVPYHNGLSLYVSPDGQHQLQIRLQWLPEGQGPSVDDLAGYIRAAP